MTDSSNKPKEAGTEFARGLGHLERACPVRAAIDVIGGRWKPSILELIYERPQRHVELLKSIVGISPQALSSQLRQLQADGVIEKDESSPPQYRLSDRGHQLSIAMNALTQWGTDYLEWRRIKGPF